MTVSSGTSQSTNPFTPVAQKVEGLRKALIEGERSGDVGELDMKKIKAKARQGAKSGSSGFGPTDSRT